jgi:hypothetical protein
MLSHATNTISKYAAQHGPIVGKYALQIGTTTVKTAIGVASTIVAVTAGINLASKAVEGAGKLRERFNKKRADQELEKLRTFAVSEETTVTSEAVTESAPFRMSEIKSIFEKIVGKPVEATETK